MRGCVFDAPNDRGVQVIASKFWPQFVHDPERYWHHEPNQIRPSDKLVSFSNGKQFMAVKMVINKFRRKAIFKKGTSIHPKRLLENCTVEVVALTRY
jgi:hypothetical protein